MGIKRWFKNENVPVVYFHGNDHSWGWTEGRYDDWPQFLSVQVDQGGKAPPIKVSIRGEAEDDFEQPDGENVFVFGEWMMVNRRGGLYEEKDAVG